ncbi:hypothetical protein [Mycobacterium sp.]|uniref:hypothetical protein n=1 Tax=Mycobacterium sp. TaxID=1785 RepID=UPI003A8494D6
MRSLRIGADVAGCVVLVAIAAGTGGCTTSEVSTQLVVEQRGRDLGRFGLDQLRGLPQVQIATPQSRGAQAQTGPTVRSVLDAAGAGDTNAVRVEGRDPAQTLAADELTDSVILNVTRRNTLKLAGSHLPRNRWVRDVTRLVVNP